MALPNLLQQTFGGRERSKRGYALYLLIELGTGVHVSIAHGAHAADARWPGPSEGSAVLTGLRLGRVLRDARVP